MSKKRKITSSMVVLAAAISAVVLAATLVTMLAPQAEAGCPPGATHLHRVDYHIEGAHAYFYSTNIRDGSSYQISTIIPVHPTNPRAVFLGWYDTPSALFPLYMPGQTIILRECLFLYAVWDTGGTSSTQYGIYYDANGGEGAPAPQLGIRKGQTAVLSKQTPWHPYGYYFLGWSTNPTATVPMYQPGGSIIMEWNNITLYAVWCQTQPSNAKGTIHVVHRDRGSNEILKQETFLVYPGSYGPYEGYGTGYFPGYGYGIWDGGVPRSGTIKAGEVKTINFLYLKSKGTVIVTHKDRDTGETLRSDKYELDYNSFVDGIAICNYGPYNARTFQGYEPGTLAAGSDPASGQVVVGSYKYVTYLYSKTPVPKLGIIKVKHISLSTGATLLEEEYTVPAGSYGPYNPKQFTGYGPGQLAPGSDPASGTIGAGQTKNITYYYGQSCTPSCGTGTINVFHVSTSTGATLLQETYSISVPPGTYGPYNPKTFSGYGQGQLAPGSAPASGTIAAGETKNIIYLYSQTCTPSCSPGTINVYHLSSTGDVLLFETYSVPAGPYGPYNSKTFSGYGQGQLAPGSAPASGTIAAGETKNITYFYSPVCAPATIIVYHKSSATGETLLTETFSVPAGQYGPFNPKSISGYGPGRIDPGVPDIGVIACGETKIIVYYYDQICPPNPATIYVLHISLTTGEILLMETETLAPGAYGPYNAKTFVNYGPGQMSSSSAPASGTINAGELKLVIYNYIMKVPGR